MANQILDNRTLIDAADSAPSSAPGWTDLASSFTGITLDTEIYVETTGSIGNYCTSTRDGTFYEWASDQNLANNHIYIWVNCGIVGLLATKASQGLTFRARGPTSSNYKEWDLAGSDDWPTTVEGGWAMFVIDLESTPSRNGGTPPATSAIRSVGITYVTASAMPRMADNIWVDEIRRLPDGSAGITVEGRNGGSTDWTWADLPTQLGASNGTAKNGPGGSIVLNTPVEFFTDDASTHAFSSTNEIVLWEDQEFAATDLYKITVLGANTGTANWSMGSKTGTGTGATGAQGGSIIAASAGVRWDFDGDISNIDSCNLYGVSCVHGGDFQLDSANVEVINTLFIDTTNVTASNSNAFLKNSYIDSNTGADAGALIWNENVDVDGILDNSSFEKGALAHHAIDFGSGVTVDQTLRGCSFNGFGSTDDANDSTVRFLATSGSLNLNLVNCTVDGAAASASNFSVDDAAGITVTVVIDPVITKVTVEDDAGGFIQNARVLLETADNGGGSGLPYQAATSSLTQSAGTATLTASAAHGLATNDYVVIRGAGIEGYNKVAQITVTSTTVFTYSVDSGLGSPAGGTPVFSYAPLHGLTDVNGEIQSSKTWPAAQGVTGWVRKSSASPYYKEAMLNIADASGGTDLLVALQPDE